MNLRQLAYFVLACQQQGFASAAEEIAVTQSTLSVSLKMLAEEIGMPLFEHVHRRFHPTAAGLWLFRSGLPLLHAENFARTWVGSADPVPVPGYLLVEVQLSFALGRVTKAISCAIETLHREFPSTFIELHFSGAGLNGNDTTPIGTRLFEGHASKIVVDAVSPQQIHSLDPGKVCVPLLDDDWVFVQSAHAGTGEQAQTQDFPKGPIVVPALSAGLQSQLERFIGEEGIPGVQSIDESPGALPRLIAERPDAVFLLPRSMVTERLGRANVSIRKVGSAFRNQVVAIHDGNDAVAARLVDQVRANLRGSESNVVFHPQLTFRQIHYHQVLHRWCNITAAARSLSVAQPSVTEQLRKMERTIGSRLFERTRDGLRPTPAGQRMSRIGVLMEEGMRQMLVRRSSINGIHSNQIRLGVLPAGDSSSTMLRCVADAVVRWQANHGSYRLKVFEAPSSTLQEMVARGTISLAVVERDVSGLLRLSLGGGEALSVVASPEFGLIGAEEIDFADAARLPLMLPTSMNGIRQILDAASAQQGVKLNVVSEVNSMALTVALLQKQAVCTILPRSAVRQLIENNVLTAATIAHPTVSRHFYAIYSAERTLIDAERDFIHELRSQFISQNFVAQ